MMEQLEPREKAIELIHSVFNITQRYLGNQELAILIVDNTIKEIREIREYHIEWGKPPNLVFKNKLEYLDKVKVEIIKYCDG